MERLGQVVEQEGVVDGDAADVSEHGIDKVFQVPRL